MGVPPGFCRFIFPSSERQAYLFSMASVRFSPAPRFPCPNSACLAKNTPKFFLTLNFWRNPGCERLRPAELRSRPLSLYFFPLFPRLCMSFLCKERPSRQESNPKYRSFPAMVLGAHFPGKSLWLGPMVLEQLSAPLLWRWFFSPRRTFCAIPLTMQAPKQGGGFFCLPSHGFFTKALLRMSALPSKMIRLSKWRFSSPQFRLTLTGTILEFIDSAWGVFFFGSFFFRGFRPSPRMCCNLGGNRLFSLPFARFSRLVLFPSLTRAEPQVKAVFPQTLFASLLETPLGSSVLSFFSPSPWKTSGRTPCSAGSFQERISSV